MLRNLQAVETLTKLHPIKSNRIWLIKMLGCIGLDLSSFTRGIQEFNTQQMRLSLQALTQAWLTFTGLDSVRVPAGLSYLSHRLFTKNFLCCLRSSFNYILVFKIKLSVRLFLHCCNKCYNNYVKGLRCLSQFYERLNLFFTCSE